MMDIRATSSTSISISLPSTTATQSLTAGKGHSKTKQAVTLDKIDFGVAAIRIQRAWRCHRNKQIFRLLKQAARAAAAIDACKLMGNRMYYEQMICDQLEHQKYRVTDVVDVATFKDYMQYTSHLDETPAHRGGRDNCWRKLSLKNMPRSTLMYDIVDYSESGTLSSRLKEEMKLLLQMPHTEDVQHRQLSTVTQVRSPAPPPSSAISTYLSSMHSVAPRNSSRRSHKACRKVAKMRRLYGPEKEQDQDNSGNTNQQFTGQQEQSNQIVFSDDDWDEEAERLYAWSQSLSLEESGMPSPVHL
ncbi:hypothetical protein GDO81_006614 [Engystomops pustulosus]|uniref:Uncharacterized protein n=1 Tax=Engystomops pustulosus TaxID=76066 RepID=A0AAV7CY24_ENGPU|nr:hypothetical protein GDO81_006614 [Engystomops pustulosus]